MPNAVPCREFVDAGDIWFSDSLTDQREAAGYCFDCPIMEQCQRQGIAEEYGVWGGLMPSDPARKAARRRAKLAENEANIERAKAMLASGRGQHEIRRILGVGIGLVSKAARELHPAAA